MIFVTSDWHGCSLQTVKDLLKHAKFGPSDFCFVLGGVTDGGEHGVELLEWLMEQNNIELLLGANEKLLLAHEYLFCTDASPALNDTQRALLAQWNAMGAMPTVTALKQKKPEARDYIFEFLQDAPLFETVEAPELPYTNRTRDYILTHSGLGGFSKEKRLSAYTPEELLFNVPKRTDRYFENATVVFGRTPAGALDETNADRILFTDTWIDIYPGPASAPALLCLDKKTCFYTLY